MKPSREWAEIKADFDRLIKTMNGDELEEATAITLGRLVALGRKYSVGAAKSFEVGEEVRYFSSHGGSDAPVEPDLRGVVEKINLEFGMLWIRKEDGKTDMEKAMNVRKISEEAEADLKDWPRKRKRLLVLLKEMDKEDLQNAGYMFYKKTCSLWNERVRKAGENLKIGDWVRYPGFSPPSYTPIPEALVGRIIKMEEGKLLIKDSLTGTLVNLYAPYVVKILGRESNGQA